MQTDQIIIYQTANVIISVGYHIKSKRGTQFRIWAKKVLREFSIKVINLLPLHFML